MMESKDAIVVTGIGSISPFGTASDTLWSHIEKGNSYHESYSQTDRSGETYSFWASKIDEWDPKELLGSRGLQYLQSSSKYLMAASLLALEDAKLNLEQINSSDIGVVVGSNFSGMKMAWEYDYTARTKGPKFVSPMQAPNTLVNSPASHLGLKIKARACNTTISSGQCAGLDAISYASKILLRKQADYLIVGGVEELNSEISWYYKNSGLLSQDVHKLSGSPYDYSSAGVIPGEGAAVAVLERLSDARKRGANILGEVTSWSSGFKKQGLDMGVGLEKTIRKSLGKISLQSNNVSLVLSGANGLPRMDQGEAHAIRRVFKDNAVPVRSIKASIGETSGANGLFQLVSAIETLKSKSLLKKEKPQSAQVGLNLTQAVSWENKKDINILLTDQDIFGASSAVMVKGV
jgi:3-oxoacyl-[acyl-carrier-protein] synthase II